MAVTRKLPTPRQPFDLKGRLRRIYRGADIFRITGFGFVLLLGLLVVWFSVRPAGSDEAMRLGVWDEFLSPEEAAQAIEVVYNQDTGTVKLQERPGGFNFAISEEARPYVRTHIKRFNKAVRGRRYNPARVPRDCILWVDPVRRSDGQIDAQIRVRDLSAYNMYPEHTRERREMGTVYMKPQPLPTPFFSDGYTGLFLLPGNELEGMVSLEKAGLHSGGRFVLQDDQGMARASVWSSEDGASVNIRAEGGKKVFIDNNPPEPGEDRPLTQGQIVEIGGRFFETRVEKSVVLATSTRRGDQVKRIYPMGRHMHFVGPVSPAATHQPLGLDYMFREYLWGVPEKDIPPGEIWLTLDPILQSELSENVSDLVRYSTTRVATGMIMNAKTGAILAMAAEPTPYDPGNNFQVHKMLDNGQERFANHGCFKRHVIGSVTKPFFAFLGLHLMPEVANIKVAGKDTSTLFGHRLYGSRDRTFVSKRPISDFATYIIQSDNSFQHAMGLMLMAGVSDLQEIPSPWFRKTSEGQVLNGALEGDPLELGGLGQFPNRITVTSDTPLAEAVRTIFDIQTTSGEGVLDDRDISIYGSLNDTMARVLRNTDPGITEPETILKRRSVVCAPESPRMELEAVSNTMDASNVLFGANRNRWTDVKLCEAFSRMVTGRKVEARLVHKYLDTTGELVVPDENGRVILPEQPGEILLEQEAPTFEEAGVDIDNMVFDRMRRSLEQVPIRGTADLLKPTVQAIQAAPEGRNFKLFAKTGTIDDVGDSLDSKLLLGTFGLWDSSKNDFDGPAYTFVLYLKNAADEDAVLKEVTTALPRWWELLQSRENEPTEDQEAEGP